MKKEKVIEIGVLLGIIILAVIVVVVAGNRYLKKSYNWYKTVIGTNGKDLGIE